MWALVFQPIDPLTLSSFSTTAFAVAAVALDLSIISPQAPLDRLGQRLTPQGASLATPGQDRACSAAQAGTRR